MENAAAPTVPLGPSKVNPQGIKKKVKPNVVILENGYYFIIGKKSSLCVGRKKENVRKSVFCKDAGCGSSISNKCWKKKCSLFCSQVG